MPTEILNNPDLLPMIINFLIWLIRLIDMVVIGRQFISKSRKGTRQVSKFRTLFNAANFINAVLHQFIEGAILMPNGLLNIPEPGLLIMVVLVWLIGQIDFVVIGNQFIVKCRKGKSKIFIILSKNKRFIFQNKEEGAEMKDDMLIDFQDVVEIFNMSVENIRKYKQMGLIKACKTKGRKDFYDKADIIQRKKIILKQLSKKKQLIEIQPIMAQYEKMQQAYLSVPKGRKKILIVDDQEAICRILSQILYRDFNEDQLAVFTCNDGETAIHIAKILIPDLIISDIVMDDNSISGIDLYERLKGEPALDSTKYIFISGAVEYKPDDTIFLNKPIPSELLVETVGKIVSIEPLSKKVKLHGIRK